MGQAGRTGAPVGPDRHDGAQEAAHRRGTGAAETGGERGEEPVLPPWLPPAARDYLAHVEEGRSIRAIARAARVHPSTVSRRVRQVEERRDDPLVDGALRQLGSARSGEAAPEPLPEGLPALRRLAEGGAVLAVAREMEMAVVVRDGGEGEPHRLAVLRRAVAESMALRGWIACAEPEARIRRYRITGRGRVVLRRALIAGRTGPGLAEEAVPFAGPSPRSPAGEDDPRLRHMRSLLPESPLAGLARRRDGGGQPWLDRDLMEAGERLREDFELAQAAPDGAPDWEGLLRALLEGQAVPACPAGTPWAAARGRVLRALHDLGPGLSDVALRCCCLLEGLEQIERTMGWAARSGKVVLRIALARLGQHYRERDGTRGGRTG